MTSWYTLDAIEARERLHTDLATGLSAEQAQRLLEELGPNELEEAGVRSPLAILWDQFKSIIVLILIVAAAISAFLGDYKDTVAIAAIVVLNAALGFTQEYRAEKAMVALRQMAAPVVRVRRDGREQALPARELVPGDIVLLEAGNVVPADGRVLESASLRAQESALTGESEPVDKITQALSQSETPLAERRNMVYMGSVVAYGRGLALVTDTGMRTELGRIATLLHTVEREPTPLQRRLDNVGKWLAAVAVALVVVIIALGMLRGEDLQILLLTAVSMAVAAIPEGLAATVTIALALGAQRMLRRRALIRKLPAVETLGSVTVICSDKTGTLTQNRMTVTALDVAGDRIDVDERLREGTPLLAANGASGARVTQDTAMRVLLMSGALCNDARLEASEDEASGFEVVGDPTEGALVVAAARFGLMKRDLEAAFPRVGELPFDSERKLMTTVHQLPAEESAPQSSGSAPIARMLAPLAIVGNRDHPPFVALTKGAADYLLARATAVWTEADTIAPLDDEQRTRALAANETLASQGMRVLGVALRPLASFTGMAEELEGLERDLIFVGQIGMIDPARPEAKEAVAKCVHAGIRTIMITGDHPLTARAIAQGLNMTMDGQALTGQELARLSDVELAAQVEETAVYARVAPEHKLRIVKALQGRGHIVAMTGDGVNDAPALRQADIGVAMGLVGTDVAKEAADIALLDDNFATIVAAVEEGRVIYDNIRKFIRYLLTTNSAEIWTMLLAPFLGMPLPLLPLQILWMNLVTDGPPALALSVEPAERATMSRPPRPPRESLFARGLGAHAIWVGLLMGALTLGLGYGAWVTGDPAWQTIVFTALTLEQMAHVIAIRSETEFMFRVGPLSNKPLLGAVTLTVLLQLALVYLPFAQPIFNTQALTLSELALCVGVSVVVFLAVEAEKFVRRRMEQRRERVEAR